MQKLTESDLNNWLDQHRPLLNINEAIFRKWYNKYGLYLRLALENGEAYLSPMLVDEFSNMKISVIFSECVLVQINDVRLNFTYLEPCINKQTGMPIPPAIIISEAEKDREQIMLHEIFSPLK